MKRYLVIYNPSSGNESAAQKAFYAVKNVMTSEDVEVAFYATKRMGDGEIRAKKGCDEGYDLIISCGGDGTVHEIVNGIMKSKNKTKFAVLPAGTVNDFAEQLNIPSSSTEFSDLLLAQTYKTVDLGKIGNGYFVNVVSGGAFTNIPHIVTPDIKTILGKNAYYFQAALEIPEQLDKSYQVKYIIDGAEYNINTYLFLITNTAGAGGFKYLCPNAKLGDGKLDIVIFEKSSPTDLLQIFKGVFNGQHIKHPKVHYFQGSNIKIESSTEMTLDVDGELGGTTPVSIDSVHNALELLAPQY